jgi:arsenate reductase (glutaredoxin)
VGVRLAATDTAVKRRQTTEMKMKMFGIKNCDTVKKARAWLEEHRLPYEFHDYKTAGIDREKLQMWCIQLGWESVLNRAGTTFRQLPAGAKESLNAVKAIELMLAQPSMIKRPVLQFDGQLLVGFKAELYERALRSAV